MYTNTDSTNYATITNTTASTSNYYLYIRGFNFDSVPSEAIINSFSIKLKASHSGGNTGTIYGYNGTTQVSTAGSTTSLDTSTSVKTFTNTTIDWDTLKNYGSNFGIRINCKRNSRNTQATFQIYGAEIEVNYTIPVYHSISFNNESQSVTTNPTTTQSVIESSNQTIQFYGITDLNSVSIEDNGTDVTSQLTYIASGNYNYNKILTNYNNTISNSSTQVTNQTNACTDTDSTTFTTLRGGNQSQYYYYYDFGIDISSIPDNATISNVTINIKACRYSTYTWQVVLCKDTTEVSNAYADITAVSSSSSSPSESETGIFTITNASFSRTELSTLRIKAKPTTSSSSSKLYLYGANITVNYIINNSCYTYTISNIQTDHTITISDALTSNKLYMKMDSMNTFITSAYSSNYDVNNLIAYVQNGAIVAGDTVLVSFTNLRRWHSGQGVSLGTFSFAFERTNTIGSWAYHYVSGDTGPGVRIQQLTAGSQLMIYPYDSRQTNAEYDGKIEVYKVTIVGGWVEMLGVFMKVNGSWVAQDISDELFDDNTVYIKN